MQSIIQKGRLFPLFPAHARKQASKHARKQAGKHPLRPPFPTPLATGVQCIRLRLFRYLCCFDFK